MNQRLLLRGRLRDVTALQKHLLGANSAIFGIVVNRENGFPRRDSIAHFVMQNDSNRRIDGIFLLLASAAENYTCRANRLTVHGCEIAILRAVYIVHVFRAREFVRILERTDVSTLQGHHLKEPLQRFSRDYESLSIKLAPRHGICGSTQVKHPAREFKA